MALARFRESIEISNLPANSSPFLAYQYLRTVVARQSNWSSSAELLTLTKDLLRSLFNGPVTPLNHIFASLVANSLADLSDRLETQIEAHAAMKEMSDGIANDQIVNKATDNSGWDTALRDTLHQRKGSEPTNAVPEQTSPSQHLAGLQHLAAAAVGEREGSDARPSSSNGNAAANSAQAKYDPDIQAAIAAANEAAKAQAQETVTGNGDSYDPNSLVKDDGF